MVMQYYKHIKSVQLHRKLDKAALSQRNKWSFIYGECYTHSE